MPWSNRWNRLIYACWSPIYNRLIRVRLISRARQRAFDIAALRGDETILLVGVGTGADIPLLPTTCHSIAIDLSRSMLRHAQIGSRSVGCRTVLIEADAQNMPVRDGSCDIAILTLILSVVPDASRCLAETVRVLKPGGRALIMDKFLRSGTRPSMRRRLLNLLTLLFGTDINRRFEDMVGDMNLELLHDEPVAFAGAYRALLLRKPD